MSPAERNVELQGSIRQFSVPDVVQFLCGHSKTGKLGLSLPDSRGAIYFDNGAVIHADAKHADMYAAIDALADKLDRLVTKHKEKLVDHHASDVARGRLD